MTVRIVFVVNKDLKMKTGKIISQVMHGYDALNESLEKNKLLRKEWKENGSAKFVLKATFDQMEEACNKLESSNIIHAKIHDAGRTQVEPGSFTVLAIISRKPEDLIGITSEFQLM